LFIHTAEAAFDPAITGKNFGNVAQNNGGGGSNNGGGSGGSSSGSRPTPPGQVLGDSTTVPSTPGQVLGASTTLPVTGNTFEWVWIALSLMGIIILPVTIVNKMKLE
jgi:hypothetical protein